MASARHHPVSNRWNARYFCGPSDVDLNQSPDRRGALSENRAPQKGHNMSMDKPMLSGDPMSGVVASAVEYMIDAGQRSVLFLDILRRRGDQYQEHIAQTAPHVLQYAAELIIDGRKLDQPV